MIVEVTGIDSNLWCCLPTQTQEGSVLIVPVALPPTGIAEADEGFVGDNQ